MRCPVCLGKLLYTAHTQQEFLCNGLRKRRACKNLSAVPSSMHHDWWFQRCTCRSFRTWRRRRLWMTLLIFSPQMSVVEIRLTWLWLRTCRDLQNRCQGINYDSLQAVPNNFLQKLEENRSLWRNRWWDSSWQSLSNSLHFLDTNEGSDHLWRRY